MTEQKTPLPMYIRQNKRYSGFLYEVQIRNIVGFNKESFTFAVESLDEALFYRNYILDLIGRERPDKLEHHPRYVPTNNPEIYAPIPHRTSPTNQEDL